MRLARAVDHRAARGQPALDLAPVAGDLLSQIRGAHAGTRGGGRPHAGRCPGRSLRRLPELQRTYPPEPFLAALGEALHYRLFDLARLEALILRAVAGDFFALHPEEEES